MKKLCIAALLLLVSSSAMADIINGGFEDGTFTGWTASGQTSITSAGTDPRTNGALSLVGNETHSARIGDPFAPLVDGYYGYSSAQQSWTKSDTFTHLYFNWAAVALVPTADAAQHTLTQTPWFQVKVLDVTTSTTLFSEEYYSGSIDGGITPGWLAGSTVTTGYSNDPGQWYYRPWSTFDLDLAGIADGDLLQVILTTRDCTLGGHASYAYLDGFGSTYVPPDTVPEPTTMILLGFGFAGLAGAARFRK